MDDRVVDERDAFLRVPIPSTRVLLKRCVEVGVGAERREEGGLVVRRPSEPAVCQTRKTGNRIPCRELFLGVRWRLEVTMCKPAPLRRGTQNAAAARVVLMKRVVQTRQHASAIPKRRMFRDLLDPLAVDP